MSLRSSFLLSQPILMGLPEIAPEIAPGRSWGNCSRRHLSYRSSPPTSSAEPKRGATALRGATESPARKDREKSGGGRGESGRRSGRWMEWTVSGGLNCGGTTATISSRFVHPRWADWLVLGPRVQDHPIQMEVPAG